MTLRKSYAIALASPTKLRPLSNTIYEGHTRLDVNRRNAARKLSSAYERPTLEEHVLLVDDANFTAMNCGFDEVFHFWNCVMLQYSKF